MKLLKSIFKLRKKKSDTTVGLFSILVTAVLLSSCASMHYRNGIAYYEEYSYAEAIKKFEKIGLQQKYPDVIFKLADCYRLTGNNVKALSSYGVIVNNRNCRPEHRFYYAEELMKAGKYSEAKTWFGKFIVTTNKPDARAERLIIACDSLNQLFKDSALYIVKYLPFNASNISCFAPAFYKDGIAFVSDRNSSGTKNFKSTWTGNKCYDIYTVSKNKKGEWMDPHPIMGNINSPWNDGPAIFNKDFNTIYFTRNDEIDNKLQKNKKDINELKIYKGIKEKDTWKTVGKLSFNNDDYSVAQPAISKDGNIIYFVSDKLWGNGGTDIYKVKFINGRWSEPENLGPNINTSGDESFPFVLGDTLLYFSSNGWGGFGGLDVYESSFKNSEWQLGANMGYPINTQADDFSYIIDDAQKNGYFSSNRNGKNDGIYAFQKLLPKINVKGIVTSFPEKNALGAVKIMISDSATIDTVIYTDGEGKFNFPLGVNSKFYFSFFEKNYFSTSFEISTFEKKSSEVIELPTALDRIKLNISKVNYKIKFDKKSTNFKKNAYKGLDEELKILQANPQIKIELAAYTDSRGTDKDNLNLTILRANSCKDYLVQKGIDESRITAIGFGETVLINQCHNNTMCIDEQHEENNRIEIKILSIENTP